MTTTPDPFEQGAIASANAIIAYLSRVGFPDAAASVHAAWESDTIVERAPAIVTDPTVVGPAKLSRQQAVNSGFTGDQCSNCGSMQMKISGHCQVCSECGTTTGCS